MGWQGVMATGVSDDPQTKQPSPKSFTPLETEFKVSSWHGYRPGIKWLAF